MKEKDNIQKISIIGAGRVGSTIAGYLAKKNLKKIQVVAVSSKTNETLIKARKALKDSKNNILFTLNNTEAVKISNCVLICTPDDRIESVCNEIFKNQDIEPWQYTVIHLSGSKKIDVLDAASKRGASVGCMHPIKSFASIQESMQSLEGTTYGLTFKSKKDEKVLKMLVKSLKGKHIIVENNAKPLYHAITCIASNYLVGLIDYALNMADSIKIPASDIFQPVLHLSEGAIENIKKMGSKKSLTGPIARGDISTVQQHIESIGNYMGPDDVQIYKALGRHTSKIAFDNKWINKNKYAHLMEILK
jgi:predicted short-subunit dehydrogenase-like oxidoreductase (DUF2520 family)